ncbi:ORF1 [Jasmine virus A-1]|nr:ORF1 [Jasmine virus A-1]
MRIVVQLKSVTSTPHHIQIRHKTHRRYLKLPFDCAIVRTPVGTAPAVVRPPSFYVLNFHMPPTYKPFLLFHSFMFVHRFVKLTLFLIFILTLYIWL